MDVEEVNLKYLQFDGKKENWSMWSKKFLAKAKKKGYKKITLGDETIPADSETLDKSKSVDKIQLMIQKLNNKAYEDLTLAMNNRIAHTKVSSAKTTELQDGDSSLAWSNLVKK